MKVIKKAVTRERKPRSFRNPRCAEWAAHHALKMSKLKKSFIKWLILKKNDYIFREVVCVCFAFVAGALLQWYVWSGDKSAGLKTDDWRLIFYKWIIEGNFAEFITAVDKVAAVVAGVSFFLKKWTDEDSENVVYTLNAALTLGLIHIFKSVNWHLMSFAMTVAAMLIIELPLRLLISKSLKDSKSRAIRTLEKKRAKLTESLGEVSKTNNEE